jgi:hypothetical protein
MTVVSSGVVESVVEQWSSSGVMNGAARTIYFLQLSDVGWPIDYKYLNL